MGPALSREGHAPMHVFRVPGMHCAECIAAITRALRNADHAIQVEADLTARIVRTSSTWLYESLVRALKRAGFRAEPVIAPLG
jgi:copper chaperone CopZ